MTSVVRRGRPRWQAATRPPRSPLTPEGCSHPHLSASRCGKLDPLSAIRTTGRNRTRDRNSGKQCRKYRPLRRPENDVYEHRKLESFAKYWTQDQETRVVKKLKRPTRSPNQTLSGTSLCLYVSRKHHAVMRQIRPVRPSCLANRTLSEFFEVG